MSVTEKAVQFKYPH